MERIFNKIIDGLITITQNQNKINETSKCRLEEVNENLKRNNVLMERLILEIEGMRRDGKKKVTFKNTHQPEGWGDDLIEFIVDNCSAKTLRIIEKMNAKTIGDLAKFTKKGIESVCKSEKFPRRNFDILKERLNRRYPWFDYGVKLDDFYETKEEWVER